MAKKIAVCISVILLTAAITIADCSLPNKFRELDYANDVAPKGDYVFAVSGMRQFKDIYD